MAGLYRLKLLLVSSGFCLLIVGLAPVGASSANISHAYRANTDVPNGSLVSLDPNQTDYVQLSTSDNGTRLLGLALDGSDSLLAVNEGTEDVQVATSGTATALVSTVNGNITVGDQVSVSAFRGIGAKATPGSHIIGLAQTDFNDTKSGTTKQSVTDEDGKTKQITIGYVRVNIGVGTAANPDSNQHLSGLQKLGKSLTGRTVSTTRIVLSMLVATVALVALITLVYTSIYSGVISIGRNPLAKYAVIRTLTAVLGMALAMAAIAMVTIVLLLR